MLYYYSNNINNQINLWFHHLHSHVLYNNTFSLQCRVADNPQGWKSPMQQEDSQRCGEAESPFSNFITRGFPQSDPPLHTQTCSLPFHGNVVQVLQIWNTIIKHFVVGLWFIGCLFLQTVPCSTASQWECKQRTSQNLRRRGGVQNGLPQDQKGRMHCKAFENRFHHTVR